MKKSKEKKSQALDLTQLQNNQFTLFQGFNVFTLLKRVQSIAEELGLLNGATTHLSGTMDSDGSHELLITDVYTFRKRQFDPNQYKYVWILSTVPRSENDLRTHKVILEADHIDAEIPIESIVYFQEEDPHYYTDYPPIY